MRSWLTFGAPASPTCALYRARLAVGRRSAVPDLGRGSDEPRHAPADREAGERPADLRRGVVGRDLCRLPRRDRRARPGAELLPQRLRRRARRGDPDRAQGRHQHEGNPDDCGLEDPRELRARFRLDRRGAVQGARPAHHRQDEHGRVRNGLVDRELGVRADTEPVGSRARPRRLVGRLGRGRGCRSRSLGARLGHRRLDQAAGRPVRRRGAPADLRHGVPRRHRRLRVEPRSGRADHEDRRRVRVPVLGHRGPGSSPTRRPSSFPSPSRSPQPRT